MYRCFYNDMEMGLEDWRAAALQPAEKQPSHCDPAPVPSGSGPTAVPGGHAG